MAPDGTVCGVLTMQQATALVVGVRGVVDAADGWLAAERGMSAVMVVQMEPVVQGSGAFAVGSVGAHIGPFGQQGAVEALDLAVGLGPVGAGEALDRSEVGDDLLELAAVAVGEGVVGQHPLDGDAMAGEEHPGPAEEPRAAVAALISQDFGIGQARVVVDGGMDIVIARAMLAVASALLERVAAMDAVTATLGEPPELLDIHVEQLAWPSAFVAADDLAAGPVQHLQPPELVAAQHPLDRRGRQADQRGDPGRAQLAGLAQGHHRRFELGRSAAGMVVGAA
jgi:hypothetical protein